jgi:cysteine synthase
MGRMKNAHNILVGKPEGENPLGRSKSRWEHYMIMNLEEAG